MSKAPDSPRHIAIIGGGISGLASAYALLASARIRGEAIKVSLINAGPRFGGVVRTTYKDGYILDEGPDCFITTKPEAMQLTRDLGVESELIGTTEGIRQSFILSKGKLEPIPKGFFLLAPTSLDALVRTPLLSWTGKMRAALDYVVPRRKASSDGPDDESLTSFVTRRFGAEVHDRIAQPMVAGIYTADPEKLSLRATFPDFLEMEAKHGSIIRGMVSRIKARSQAAGTEGAGKASGARYGMFRSFRLGMGQLVSELLKHLEGKVELHRDTIVTAITKKQGGFRLSLKGGGQMDCDQLIMATSAKASARLLARSDNKALQELGAKLRPTQYASAATVSLAYDPKQISHSMNGMGFVVPAIEGRKILACSFSHQKWQGRAPEGKALLRAFVGGAMMSEIVGMSDKELGDLAQAELTSILGITGEPELVHVARSRHAMAQYHVGHVDRVAEMRQAEAACEGLAMAGNGFDGVGIPDCIRNAKRAAKRLLED